MSLRRGGGRGTGRRIPAAVPVQHANLGKPWEDALQKVLYGYQAGRGAYWYHTHPPTAQKPGAKADAEGYVRMKRVGEGPPDLRLDVAVDGREWSFLMEAKKTEEANGWRFQGLKKHQAEHLDRFQRVGPHKIAGILLWEQARSVSSFLLWEDFGPKWWAWFRLAERNRGLPDWMRENAEDGTARLSRAEIDQIALVQSGLWLDFLDGVCSRVAARRFGHG